LGVTALHTRAPSLFRWTSAHLLPLLRITRTLRASTLRLHYRGTSLSRRTLAEETPASGGKTPLCALRLGMLPALCAWILRTVAALAPLKARRCQLLRILRRRRSATSQLSCTTSLLILRAAGSALPLRYRPCPTCLRFSPLHLSYALNRRTTATALSREQHACLPLLQFTPAYTAALPLITCLASVPSPPAPRTTTIL